MTRNNVTATPEPETETHTYRCQQRMNVDEVRQVMRRRFSFSHEAVGDKQLDLRCTLIRMRTH